MYGNYDNRNNIARHLSCWALSIIRFRTVIKDTKDILYIFWSLAVGMACGTGNFIALASSVIITITAFLLYKTNYGSTIYKSEFILQFRYNKFDENTAPYLDILKKFCSSHVLLNSRAIG